MDEEVLHYEGRQGKLELGGGGEVGEKAPA
jgi:hypothetical protein